MALAEDVKEGFQTESWTAVQDAAPLPDDPTGVKILVRRYPGGDIELFTFDRGTEIPGHQSYHVGDHE